MAPKIENAVIVQADIMIEDHGMLVFNITVDYGGPRQGFPGYRLDSPDTKYLSGGNHGGWHIKKLMETLGVTKFSKLLGKNCRVASDGGLIRKIGHIIENKWYDPSMFGQENS